MNRQRIQQNRRVETIERRLQAIELQFSQTISSIEEQFSQTISEVRNLIRQTVQCSSTSVESETEASSDSEAETQVLNYVPETIPIPKIFDGFVICLSGMDLEEKSTLEKLIDDNGGTTWHELRKDETHVLVCEKASGRKYVHVMAWQRQNNFNTSIVNKKWVTDSVQKGRAQKVLDYKI